MTSKQYSDKVIWITGASSGIGEGLARALCDAGAKLILSARRESELNRVKESCSAPDRIAVLPLDLCEFEVMSEKVTVAENHFGPIDIMIHNGGISQRGLVADTGIDVDQRIMNTNYLGTVALTKALLPSMLKRKSGQFVVVSSRAGYCGTPLRSAYAASKHALHGFFECLRAEVHDDGISIMMVCPGFIKTNISLNALGPDGQPHGKMDKGQAKGMSQQECAARVLRGIARQQPELWIGGGEIIGGYIRRFAPAIYRRLIRAADVT